MGVYINMEMPNKKNGAVLIIYPDGRCAFENGKEYKAVPVPSHGRLIDADALCDLIDNGFDLDFDEVPETKRELLRMIADAPTIIPAEEAKE